MLFPTAPSRPPDVIFPYNTTSKSLIVKWSHVPKQYFNGKPTGYNISYYPATFEWNVRFVTVDYKTNSTELSNLAAFTIYVIKVAAVSSGGVGPRSMISVQTKDAGIIDCLSHPHSRGFFSILTAARKDASKWLIT